LERIVATASVERHGDRIGFVHAIVVGAAVLGALFILCWASDALGVVPATHRYITLFTDVPETASTAALIDGLPWALAFGALSGATLAFFSNAFRFLARR
jgi:hypothetical protein